MYFLPAFFFQIICTTDEGSVKTPVVQYDTSTGFGKHLAHIICSIESIYFSKEASVFAYTSLRSCTIDYMGGTVLNIRFF